MSKSFGHAGTLLEVLNKNKENYKNVGCGSSFDQIIESLIKLETSFYVAVIRYSDNMILAFQISFDMDARIAGNYSPLVNVYRLNNYGKSLGKITENINNPKFIGKVYPELLTNRDWYFYLPIAQPDGSFTHKFYSSKEGVERNEYLNKLRVKYGYDVVDLENEVWYKYISKE